MRSLCVSAMRNSSVPALWPALINAPMSVLRAVMTPVKGATTRLNDSSSRSRDTLAAAESAAAFFAAASPAFSSASCLETDSVASNPCQRTLVLLDRASLARAVARSACAWRQLLVDLGRVDFGQQLALGHLRSDVGAPFFQIAAGARIDGRLHDRPARCPAAPVPRRASLRFGVVVDTVGMAASAVSLRERGARQHPADLAPNAKHSATMSSISA